MTDNLDETNELKKLFGELNSLHEKKGQAYGNNARILNRLMDVLKEELGEPRKDLCVGEYFWSIEMLVKWLRYWKIYVIDGKPGYEDSLKDLIVYAGMVLCGQAKKH